MNRKILLITLVTLIPLAALMFFMQSASAADPTIGCRPYNLTVKTGTTFYITVAVTDTVDLYAWQINARYYPEYLEFVRHRTAATTCARMARSATPSPR